MVYQLANGLKYVHCFSNKAPRPRYSGSTRFGTHPNNLKGLSK
jgi:hypothetical protein